MVFSAASDTAAAMVVDREAEGAASLLGTEEDKDDDVLSSPLSASRPTPAVVDDKYGRFPWTPLGRSVVEQRFGTVDSRRMTSIWTTLRGIYEFLDAVSDGTVTDVLFLRSREVWRVCQVRGNFAVRGLPPEVGDKPHFSWEYYPESPLKVKDVDRGFYVPGAMGEWTIGTSLHPLTLYEQREVPDAPVLPRKGLYPTTPVWWEQFEVPRGMAARVPQMVVLQGSQLMAEPLRGPYHLMLAALWAFEVADVFLGSVCHLGHVWRLPLAMLSAFSDLTTERLCSADPSARSLLEAGVELLRRIKERARATWLQWLGRPRGDLRRAKTLDEEGTFVLLEGLGDPRLPYGRDVTAALRLRLLDRDLAGAESVRAGLVTASKPPSAPAATASAPVVQGPPLWGAVSRPAYMPRGPG